MKATCQGFSPHCFVFLGQKSLQLNLKPQRFFSALPWSPAEHLAIFRMRRISFFLLSIPQQSIREQTSRETGLHQGWVVSCTPSFGLHWSRQKASSWLQLEKYWAPQLNIESAEHPQLLQNQCGLQTGLKNKLLPAHNLMLQLFACSYFCISPSLLHYLEMASIVTTVPPLFFFSEQHIIFS